MSGTFTFCPNSLVATTVPRPGGTVVDMNGWQFTSKPTNPYQRKFKVTLHGLRWYTQSNGLFDTTTNTTVNARLLEQFYEAHETWDSFTFAHPHLGSMTCRFAEPMELPAGIDNSGGLLPPVEIMLIHHNPGY